MAEQDVVDRLARSVVTITQDTEQSLLTSISRSLAQGIDSPDWEQHKLSEVTRLRARWERLTASYLTEARTAIGTALLAAGEEGERLALSSLTGVLRATPTRLPGAGGVVALAQEISGMIESTRYGILRSTEDIYRGVISQTVGRVLLGSQTRRSVAQVALDHFASAGVGSFVDRAGRRWEMASYTEMAMRTGAQRAMTQAHTETLVHSGVQLVIVSDAPQECRLCRPWEGKVLSLTSDGQQTLHLPSEVSDDLVTVEVAGGLDEAKRAGLMHPNCRHSVSAYLPGLTRRPAREAPDPEGDAARQRLRALERRVRAAKRREASAMSDAARVRARADVRAHQADIRQHVARTSVMRQRHREQIGRAR